MVALVLLIISAVLFLLAALNQSLFDEGPGDLVVWGLLAWVLSVLFGAAQPYLGRFGDRQ